MCGTDKPQLPKGFFTWRSQPFIFLKHTSCDPHSHTQRQITPNLNCVIHAMGSLKGGVCLQFYSSRSWMSVEYESQWLRLQRWLTQIRWPLIYTCCINCVFSYLYVWSWLIHSMTSTLLLTHSVLRQSIA